MNLKIKFLFFLIFKLISIKSDLSSYSIGISDTRTYQGYFVRKITPNKIYIGNLFEEKTYDLINKISGKYYKPCICGTGTACPLIVLDSNNNPTYSVSKKGDLIQVIELNYNRTQTSHFGYNMMGIYKMSDTYALVGARTSNSGIASRGFRAIQLKNINQFYTNDINPNYELGFILLSDSQRLIFSQYSSFYYSFIDEQVHIYNWIQISKKNSDYYGYHQIIEISEKRIILCLLSGDKTHIDCLSATYGNKSLTLEHDVKTVLEDCSTSENHESFSFYKWTDETGILGCGKHKLQIAIINYGLDTQGKILTIQSTNYVFIDFTVLERNKLYFILATSKTSGYSYYGDILYVPSCENKYVIINAYETYNIINIFAHSTNIDVVNTKEIMFIDFPVKNYIFKDNILISKNIIYSVEDLYFKTEESLTYNYNFKGIGSVFGYYDDYYDSPVCSFTVVVCSEFCKTCTLPATSTSNKCDSCDNDKGYYRSEDNNENCYNSTYLPGENYYLDKSDFPYIYRKCLDNCKLCNEKGDVDIDTKCTLCNDNFFPIEGHESHCLPNSKIIEGYVFYNNRFVKCHSNCKTCSKPPSGYEMNCDECKGDLIKNHPYIANNCVNDCSGSYWYIGANYEFKCVNGKECTQFYPYLVEETGQCTTVCHDYYTCKYCEENGPLYAYNGKCVKECPNGISYNNICLQILDEKTKPNITESVATYKMDTDVNSNDFKLIINQGIDLGFSTAKNNDKDMLTTIKAEDYVFNFYPSDMNSSIIKENGSPVLDLGECENILRKAYDIPADEELYISQIVYQNTTNNSATYPLQYEVYRESTEEKVDLSPCDGVKIKISQPMLNKEQLNIELGLSLLEEGINIYDPEDEIFNDRCTSLSVGGKDVSMKDRREQIYTPASFCGDGCSVGSINLTSNDIECECEPQSGGFTSLLEENEVFSAFTSLIESTNIEMFRCYKLITLMDNAFIPNYANWMMIPVIISIGSLSFVFVFVNMKSIYSLLNKHVVLAPIKKPRYKDSADDDNYLNPIQNAEQEMDPVSEDLSSQAGKKFKINNYLLNTNEVENAHTLSEEKPQIIENNDEPEENVEELNEMNYREASRKDNRTFFRYFIHIAAEKQIILSTILNKSIFYPLSLRLILLLFTLMSFFFFNGMLFTEEYISERYNTTESLDIWYLLKNELSKSVYASIIGMFITKFISMMLSSEGSFTKLYEEKGDVFYYQNFKVLVSDMKKKYYIVLAVIMIMSIIYWYFLFIFCHVYKSNQLSWIQSSLFSILFNFILPVSICLMVALLRIISLRFKIR